MTTDTVKRLPATTAGHAQWQVAAAAYYVVLASKTEGSTRTAGEYSRVLRRFFDRVGDPFNATPADVVAFAYGAGPDRYGRPGREPSPSTTTVRLAALRGYYRFSIGKGFTTTDPTVHVEGRRQRDAVPRGLDADELRKLLDVIPSTPIGLRDRAFVLTCVLTGLRRSEVVGLTVGSLTRNGRLYYQTRTKGGRAVHRELPLPAYDAIVASLDAAGRPIATLDQDARLFPVSSGVFARNLKRYADRAGLTGVTVHALRHSAARLRRDNGASVEDVQRLLGHRNLATTARYLTKLQGEHDDGWHAAAAALGVA